MALAKKWCVLCGKEGHSSHECPYSKFKLGNRK